jgi:hypothetical protein
VAKIKIRIPRAATPGAVVDYASSSKAGTVVALMFIIGGLDLLRRGWPGTPGAFTAQRGLAYFGAALAFVLLANFAPTLAEMLLWGIVVLQALNLAPQITAWIKKINAGLASPSFAIPHGPLPTV